MSAAVAGTCPGEDEERGSRVVMLFLVSASVSQVREPALVEVLRGDRASIEIECEQLDGHEEPGVGEIAVRNRVRSRRFWHEAERRARDEKRGALAATREKVGSAQSGHQRASLCNA